MELIDDICNDKSEIYSVYEVNDVAQLVLVKRFTIYEEFIISYI